LQTLRPKTYFVLSPPKLQFIGIVKEKGVLI